MKKSRKDKKKKDLKDDKKVNKKENKKQKESKKKYEEKLEKYIKSSNTRRIFWKVLKIFIVLAIIFGVIFGGAAFAVWYYFGQDLPDITQLRDFNVDKTTYIYDREGNELYKIFSEENRDYIELANISEVAQKAFISIEDKKFYEHLGIDVTRIIKAFYVNLEDEDLSQGASTITQQLVRNMLLSNEKTYERKIKEIILSLQAERIFTKDEILEMYLNKIAFGTNAYGIEAASKTFFEKSANELDLLESSILASLPKAPTYYSPYGQNRDLLMGYCKLNRDENDNSLDIDAIPTEDLVELNIKVVGGESDTWMRVVPDTEDQRQEFFLKAGETREFAVANEFRFLPANTRASIFVNGRKLREYGTSVQTVINLNNFEELTDEVTETEENAEIASSDQPIKCESIDDPNYVKGRKDLVLIRMFEDSHINREQLDEAWERGLNFRFNEPKIDIKEPHFVFYVKEYLEEKYGYEMVNSGGLHVTTTLDPDLQFAAHEAIDAQAPTNASRYKASNSALVSLDPKTGEILAMVGSKDYYDESIDGQVNVATSYRQPGSSFKPFIYAAAFENGGHGSGTNLADYKTVFNGDYKHIPNNSDGSYKGAMNIRRALALSRNIPAIKAFFLAGEEEAILDYLDRVGLNSIRDLKDKFNEDAEERGWTFNYGWPLALGTGEVRLLDLATGYGVFANEGRLVTANPILELKDDQGNVIEGIDRESVKGDQVINPQVAFIVADILSDEFQRPPGSWRNTLTVKGKNVAAKTGTSNKEIGNAVVPSNGLTIGFTPSIVTAVWSGNSDGAHMANSAYGLYVAGPIFNQFMSFALADKEYEEFPVPEGIQQIGNEFYPDYGGPQFVDNRFVRVKTEEELEEEAKEKAEADGGGGSDSGGSAATSEAASAE